MSPRAAAGLAWSMWAISVPLAVSGGLLGFLDGSGWGRPDSAWLVVFAALIPTFPTIGALVASRRPENPIGWIFCAAGLFLGIAVFTSGYVEYALRTGHRSLPGVEYAAWLSEWVAGPASFLGATMVFLLFPDGRLPSPLVLWRPVAWTAIVGSVFSAFGEALGPGLSYPSIANPVAVGGAVGDVLMMLGGFGGTFLFLSCVASMSAPFLRLHQAGGEKRQQLKWFVYATILTAASFLLVSAVGSVWQSRPSSAAGLLFWGLGEVAWNLMFVGFLLLPVAVGIAILRYSLYDIDRIINRTLVYGALTAIVVGIYVLVVGGLGSLVQARGDLAISLLAVGVVAVLFLPLRKRLQRFADRLIPPSRPEAQETTESSGRERTVLGRISRRTAVRLARSVWVLSVALVSSSFVLDYLTIPAPRDTPILVALFRALSLAYPTVGAVIASRRPENPIGWIFCGAGLVNVFQPFAVAYADYTVALPGSLPGGVWMAWISSWIGFPTVFLTTVLLLLLFPDGRLPSLRVTGTSPLFPDGWLPSRYWRIVVWMAACASAVIAIWLALWPGALYSHPAYDNPFGIGASVWAVMAIPMTTSEEFEGAIKLVTAVSGMAGVYLGSVSVLFAAAAMLLRTNQAEGEKRQQLKWFVYAVVVLVSGFLCSFMGLGGWGPSSLPWYVGIAAFHFFPIAAGIAIFRYRLYDIDVIVNRALVYGTLTTIVVAAYALVVGVLSTLLQTNAGKGLLIPILATGLIAVLFTPARNRLQRSVNRMMYGDRDDPYMVLSRLGKRLESTLAPGAVLPGIVETVAHTLKLPYAAILLKQGDVFTTAAEYGTPSEEPVVLPLAYGTETVGRFVLAARAPGEPFTASELRLLEDLARQVGVAAYAVRLTADLQRSRERLVNTREEERRRLRRDLHDGLGPRLATFTLKLDAARNMLASEPEVAGSLLLELKAQTQETISGIRRLAYDLRPPALDELGLVSALREQATDYGPAFSVEALEELPPLPAAVEVAAYRIALEAMTNTARHARARVCRVRIVPSDEELMLEVSDDGIGLPEDHRAGIGLSSMRERAAEIGGTCVIEAFPSGGTRVVARLPVEGTGAEVDV